MDYRMELMDRIMAALFNSDEWNRIFADTYAAVSAAHSCDQFAER